jgi:hypothetical protein
VHQTPHLESPAPTVYAPETAPVAPSGWTPLHARLLRQALLIAAVLLVAVAVVTVVEYLRRELIEFLHVTIFSQIGARR